MMARVGVSVTSSLIPCRPKPLLQQQLHQPPPPCNSESRSAAASMEVRLKALARPLKLQWFAGFPVTSESRPAMLEGGLASLSPLRG